MQEYLQLGKVNLGGTSREAWVAVNVALERKNLVKRVVAHSFDGRTLADNFAENLIQERSSVKEEEMGVGFYQWCQGNRG